MSAWVTHSGFLFITSGGRIQNMVFVAIAILNVIKCCILLFILFIEIASFLISNCNDYMTLVMW